MKEQTKPLLISKQASYGNEESILQNGDNPSKFGVKPYDRKVAIAMCLNYIIGTGCFGLQYAFMKTGILLTSLFLLVGLILAMISMNYTLESMARADGVKNAVHHELPKNRISYQKFDFSVIGNIFGGKSLQIFVQFVVVCYCVGTLWAYASVFSSSVSSLYFTYVIGESCNVFDPLASSGCVDAYFISMAIYAGIVITLVLMNLGDQAGIQMFLSMYRIAAIIIMLITLLIKVAHDGDLVYQRANLIGNFNWSHFGSGFGPTILAINCHYNMPDALQPLNDKKNARFVTFISLFLSCILYLLIGLLGAIAFDDVNPLATLNWSNYSGCGNGWTPCNQNIIGVLTQLIILLFPVVNVTSAYPMVGITMGDNLSLSISNKLKEKFGLKAITSICRLVATIPPLILALIFKKLDFIFTVAGLFGFILGLTIPCIFQVSSIRHCYKKWGTLLASETAYTSFVSHISVASMFLIASFFITGLAIATITP